MQRRRVDGDPEAVFAEVQRRLGDLGVTPTLVDPSSITLLFDMAAPRARGPTRFFLAVVPAGAGKSDVALARGSRDRRRAMRAMLLTDDDPIESEVLDTLLRAERAPVPEAS